MSNPFGPQGANAATQLPGPVNKIRYGNFNTWVKDCSSNHANDGTSLDAQFFNNIIGALNNLVDQSGINNTKPGDTTILSRAVTAIVLAQTTQIRNDVAAIKRYLGLP